MRPPRLPSSWPQPGLLAIPLVRHALSDPNLSIRLRGVDRGWHYERLVQLSVGGFNPYRRSIYVCAESALATWLAGGCSDDRGCNEADFLVGELLFFVHDYLHCWAVGEIQRMLPGLGFGAAPIDAGNLEDMVFCHLLTEAAATVGLDYWYLSTVDLNQVCDVGTNYRGLTVQYSERHAQEYRRFDPSWDMQSVAGFERVARFYCTGEFPGFGLEDLRRSAVLHAWMRHELRYGVNQRAYTRQWFVHLANGALALAYEDSRGPVACDAAWQRDLIDALGRRLWAKVKGDEAPARLPAPAGEPWRRRHACADYRFTNINALAPAQRAALAEHEDTRRYFDLYAAQAVSRCRFQGFPAARLPALRRALHERDLAALRALVEDPAIATVEAAGPDDEPLDLMFLN